MLRYELKKSKQKNTLNLNTNLENVGTIHSSEMFENNSRVLTKANIANNIDDSSEKIPSLSVIKEMIEKFTPTGMSKNTALLSDIQNCEKDKKEILAKTEVLLDSSITPELENSLIKEDLTNALNDYLSKEKEIVDYMNTLLEEDNITDDMYNIFTNLVVEYSDKFSYVNKCIQKATQVVMTLKSEAVLKIANENMQDIASKITYRIEIFSSNGPFFKKGQINTDLSTRVFLGKEELTDTFNDLQFRWSRKSKEPLRDEIWNMNAKRGKKISITNDDYVNGGCSFICDLYDELGRKIASSSN